MRKIHGLHLAVLVSFCWTLSGTLMLKAQNSEPFKLGVQEQGYATQQGGASYPSYPSYPTYQAPKLQPSQPRQGRADNNVLQGNATSQPPRQLNAGTSQRVVLPPQFLGTWNVTGQRTKLEARPEYRAGFERVSGQNTTSLWEISEDGSGGYVLSSNRGAKDALVVENVQGNMAVFRWEHSLINSVIQEAIVMQLSSGGAKFTALERITIVKPGEPPRARITYELVGIRQR